LSLRRFFPEHWDGTGSDFKISQQVAEVIGFIEVLALALADLIGHSRGGHIALPRCAAGCIRYSLGQIARTERHTVEEAPCANDLVECGPRNAVSHKVHLKGTEILKF
jgi:hypothetical protein